MKKCLVCLVSDQTIPNITVTLHFEPDFLLLITTPAMERKGKARTILNTLRLRGLDYSNRHAQVEVQEDSLLGFEASVSRWIDEAAEEYAFTVNLTGGTKLMSIAAYDLFSSFGSEMVYVPIPRNEFLTPFPKRRPRTPTPLGARLSVIEYLTAYGFTVTNETRLEGYRRRAESREATTRFVFQNYEALLPLLQWLGSELRPLKPKQVQKGHDFTGTFQILADVQAEFLGKFNFELDGDQIRKRIDKVEWDYLRGGWLEDRLFLAVRAALSTGTDVELNVECKDPKGNQNEFDVLFTADNALYLVECKSLGASEGGGDKIGIPEFLYKLGALRQSFGLTPKAYLATTADSILDKNRQVKPHLTERAGQFSTKIVPLLAVKDIEGFFRDEFNPRR